MIFLSKHKTKGFVLPLTLLICMIMLMIATGISIILAKELYFSKLSRLSQIAYYAADSGLKRAYVRYDGRRSIHRSRNGSRDIPVQ
jgi:hypothetical protein